MKMSIDKHTMKLSWLENGYSRPFFSAADFDLKVAQTDVAFGV